MALAAHLEQRSSWRGGGAHHHPEQLEAAQQAELTRILAAADREIV